MNKDAMSQFALSNWDEWAQNGFLLSIKADTVLIGWGKPERLKTPGNSPYSLYAPDFYLEDEKPWIHFPNVALLNIETLLGFAEESIVTPVPNWNWQEPDIKDFQNQFNKVQASIQSGEIHKAVPVTFLAGECESIKKDFARLIIHLFTRAGKRTPYGLWMDDEGILGASPEVLFHIRGDDSVLETMALAGTRMTDFELKHSLINDPKEMYEHELVIKGLKEVLSPKGNLRITPTYIWDIGKICHLRTDIEVELHELKLSSESFLGLINDLHPTAALGLSPVTLPASYMKKFESKIPRGRFGAPFGVLEKSGRTRVLVAIRNLIWKKQKVYIGTGAGIVAASQLENEWREHLVKRQTVRDLFGV